MNTDKHRCRKDIVNWTICRPIFLSVFICVHLWLISSCSSNLTDPRSVAPADSLVYLETRDLGKAVGVIVSNPKLKEAATALPDVSILNGMEMAVAVTGFETSEQAITEENSVLNFQPRFVAVLETHKWNYQVIGFVEEKLGLFISEAYGGEATLETSDKHGGKYFVWSGQDGRKAFALVVGSLIYFGNDESAIEKCLAVQRGEAESIAKNPKITTGERLAFGYVSPDGVAQIANIAGISLAKQSSEEGDVQSFIARVLPELLRNSLKEATWTATQTEHGIADDYVIGLNDEVSKVFGETIVPSGTKPDEKLTAALPLAAASFTRYDLRDPQVAWRSVLLSAQKLTDQATGNILLAFSSSLFEPYGIDDPEMFLSSIGPIVHTVKFDESGDKVLVIATVKDAEKVKRSLAKEIDFKKPPERIGNADSWLSRDSDVRVIFDGTTLVVGDPQETEKLVSNLNNAFGKNHLYPLFASSTAASVTFGSDTAIALRIADVLSERKPETAAISTYSLTETRFNQNGMERRTVSDFGLIGTIISQFSPE